MRYFALCLPGIGPLLRDELADLDVEVDTRVESDGRADIAVMTARGDQPPAPALAEDVFVEIAHCRHQGRVDQLARSLLPPAAFEQALSAWIAGGHRLRPRMGYRVIARVADESSFRRTELRAEMEQQVLRLRPRWHHADPAELEIWALQTAAGIRCGMRLTAASTRQHGGRAVQRPGALRPTVAAAMVRLAGDPGRLLDCCCGSGTILTEALARGWTATGLDIDPDAVAAARANAPGADISDGDARRLPLADASVDAIVSNLPFGERFAVADDLYPRALSEMARVCRRNGRIVLLAPASRDFRAALMAARLREHDRLVLRLLGQPTTLWQLRPPRDQSPD